MRLIERIETAEPTPPRALEPRIPRDLETIVAKAIDKDPAHRYPTAGELAEDLRRFLDDEPIRARRLSPTERLGRWSRRHKAVAALLGTLFGVLLTSLAGMTLLYSRGRDNAVVASRSAQRTRLLAGSEARARQKAEAEERRATEHAKRLAIEDYINRVNRAYREVQNGNVALSEDLLHGCPPGRRGWEWHYVKRLGHLARLTLEAPGTSVNALAFSPDGTWFVSSAGQSIVEGDSSQAVGSRVFQREVATGDLRRTFDRIEASVYSLAISPYGRRIAIGSGFMRPRRVSRVELWDAATWRPLW